MKDGLKQKQNFNKAVNENIQKRPFKRVVKTAMKKGTDVIGQESKMKDGLE